MTFHESAHGRRCCLVCPATPVVVVADQEGDEALLCQPHWKEALTRSDGLIRAVRLHRPPAKGAE